MTGRSQPLTWYFDVISPFAYLALDEVETLGCAHDVALKPILFAGLLKHWGHLGPAEIPPKRIHTYRQCVFIAQERGIPFRMPPAHPFNPLAALRLIAAAGTTWKVVRIVMNRIWQEGANVADPAEIEALALALGVENAAQALESPEVKAKIRTNTDEAIAAGVFGVPTLKVGAELFWGLDAMPMARAFMANPALFSAGELARVGTLYNSMQRPRPSGS